MRISSDQNGSVENAYLGFEVRQGSVGEKNSDGGVRVAQAGRFKALAFERGSLAIVAQWWRTHICKREYNAGACIRILMKTPQCTGKLFYTLYTTQNI